MKRKIFLVILLLFLFSNSAVAGELSKDHWAFADIKELIAREVLPSDINPEAYITRAQFTEMLIKCLDLNESALKLSGAPSPFIDVSPKHPLKPYILAALERGLVRGYSEEIFRPEEELRRDQMIVLLMRVIGLDNSNKDKLEFKDTKYIPTYARPSIAEGVNLDLVKGFADKTFRPSEKVTFAQGAAFINRWLEIKGDRYDYIGIWQGLEKNKFIIQIGTENISFQPEKKILVLNNGKESKLNQIKKGSEVALKTNSNGKVTIIHQKKIALSDIPVSLTAQNFQNRKINIASSSQVANLFNPRIPLNKKNIAQSLETTKAEINLPSLRTKTGSQGEGQTIAIIDTGIDVSHPDLELTTDGKPKVVDWVDFTLEGIVNLEMIPQEQGSYLAYQGEEYFIGDIISRSQTFRIGILNTNDIIPIELLEFTDEPLNLGVLLVDSQNKGVYDTVYIDTNNDKSFIDEAALKIYREGQHHTTFFLKGRDLSLVVVDIDPRGGYIQVANDISGHGTHVAGIIAANGKVKGVAPGVQLMVLKAVDRDGYADPSNIVEAIRYAALHDADIINISLGQYQDTDKRLSDIVNEAVEKYGTIVVAAAGNTGPGINTVASPADAEKAISVGAFVSPRMWKEDFGYNVPEDSLYYFSSVGPKKDGSWYPSLVAPGSAVSTVPLWMNNEYMLTEGTSMAAPHVSGAIAHLLENAAKNKIKVTPSLIKKALEESARDLANAPNIEGGHGIIDIYAAWFKLQSLTQPAKITTEIFGQGAGLYTRDFVPKRLNLTLNNNDNRDYYLHWSTEASWLKPQLEKSFIMRKSTRTIPLDFSLPDKAGLYSTALKGNDPSVAGVEVEIPINIVVGEKINQKTPPFAIMDKLGPAQFKRYFVQVPEGAGELKATLEIFPSTNKKYQGRARIHLIGPSGQEEYMSEYAGAAPFALPGKSKVEVESYVPQAGTWEIIVYSSASLSSHNLKESKYQLTIELGDVIKTNPPNKTNIDILVAPIPKKALEKSAGSVVLHIWDLGKNKPYNGALEINGHLYQIEKGKLEYNIAELKKNGKLSLRSI